MFQDQPLDFSIEDNTIFIKKKQVASKLSPHLNLDAPPITGTVRGPDGKPLAGINVIVKNTNKGVVTDANGRFSIVAQVGSLLIFSSVGYNSREIKVSDGESLLNIALTVNNSPLDEVQIIAYGTTNKTI